MNCSLKALPVIAVLLAAAPVSGLAQEAVPAEHAVRFIGKDVMVCGTVEKTRWAQNTEGEPTFLYMGGSFPRHTFSARIPGNQRGKFKPTPEELEGRDICVVGTVQRDASRAEIAVSSPSSIKLANLK